MKNIAKTPPSPHTVELPAHALRRLLLAQAIERQDSSGALLSPAERAAALQQALDQAQARGLQRVQLGDILLPRAQALLQQASAHEPAIAALERNPPSRWLPALALLALLAGLLADRISNAHRVDLLSPPLLLVLAWNLLIYALLAWQALRPGRGQAAQPLLLAAAPLLQRLAHWGTGRRQTLLLRRIQADFQTHWLAHSAAWQAARSSYWLHLCAAAWGAGLALSLLLRGLVVRYQLGWESTFLQPEQVHGLTRLLFAPLTLLTGNQAFTLEDILHSQDFAGQGSAGSRWVWLYVGLLALYVLLPRLALAAWAGWRARRLAARLRLDLDGPQWDALRAALPHTIRLGLLGGDRAQHQGAALVLASHAPAQARWSDHLLLCLPQADADPVDALLLPWEEPAGHAGHSADDTQPPCPPAWQTAPRLALPWADWGARWTLEPQLPAQLARLLPQQAAALQRIAEQWASDNQRRFDAALALLTAYLRRCSAPPAQADQGGESNGNGNGAAAAAAPAAPQQAWQTLQTALHALYQLPPPEAAAGPVSISPWPLPAGQPSRPMRTSAVTTAGAAAGAAAGAQTGALIDLGLGGLTLGLGATLGALLGGATAWTARSLQQRSAQRGQRQALLVSSCLLYLAVTHQGRLTAPQAEPQAALWQQGIEQALARYWTPQSWPDAAPEPDPLTPLLRQILQAVLQYQPTPTPARQADRTAAP